MNPYEIIDKYYPENTQQRQILVIHSLAVSGKAMKMLDAHPELRLNRSFVKEAALLHGQQGRTPENCPERVDYKDDLRSRQ